MWLLTYCHFIIHIIFPLLSYCTLTVVVEQEEVNHPTDKLFLRHVILYKTEPPTKNEMFLHKTTRNVSLNTTIHACLYYCQSPSEKKNVEREEEKEICVNVYEFVFVKGRSKMRHERMIEFLCETKFVNSNTINHLYAPVTNLLRGSYQLDA